ncbi:metal-dependent transcriptional regulator [Goodfellowiella coeruleoviolacea]|uniref:Iron (Metal) dependent repressor, DtxR family n=1 Tax=Goodfellowiella coeruleoviolacea TaxID=334858 RepID=A0AAE3G7U3_9PSEU|nr:metal-dependent transcriptional regulator [Goodfellowiella coeruleoviolacea]MCP2163306.1 iron (metal) dependent repressor, DtxR family [Goodfellowiella coeruleoviolacea]
MTAQGLIDTTEMYLKSAYELEEDGVVAMRARIADRLGQSAPTVSQTVARLQRGGLLQVREDRRLELSVRGRQRAVRVMRKHRLAEVLLYTVIGLDWPQLHVEACRWEHVMSDQVEPHILRLCGYPRYCPYGNPIPGLAELGVTGPGPRAPRHMHTVAAAATSGWAAGVVHRISERIQDDVAFLSRVHAAGMLPGSRVTLTARSGTWFELSNDIDTLVLDRRQANLIVLSGAADTGRTAEGAQRPRYAAIN